MDEETLFHEALARPPSQRDAFLEAACGGRTELRAAVDALLAAHEASGELCDGPPAGVESAVRDLAGAGAARSGPEDVSEGTVIAGRYALVQKIGEGGMGEVWAANQNEPIKRRVALKLIKAGMDSRAVLGRFEQERQALAMMDHPNIARVFDAGMTDRGQPFFVMELVDGAPLSQFCDEVRLAPRERLELFVAICHAVQHAHQKGIVHRDLKPANVLVTLIDGKPVPKVIDFGVAKATSGKLTEETLATDFGMVVGTLEYMSPEQAGFSGTDIDTRTDIYSLGVILYELLTGLRPIDAEALRNAAMMDMVRLIRDEDPLRPSTRLSTDQSLPSLAAFRRTDPKKLMALLRGELDWVVMKCLEKQRDRRYESAGGLARDVERYLAGEAVEARPPSRSYRIRKFLRRHKGPVAAAAVVLLALVAGVIGTSIGLFRAEEQRRMAVAAEARAQKRLTQVEKANEILGSVFSKLNPRDVAEEDVSLRVLLARELDTAAKQLDGEAVGDPLVVASLQQQLGTSLVALGDAAKGVALLDKALDVRRTSAGSTDEGTLRSMTALAAAYHELGRGDEAVALAEEVHRICQETRDPDDRFAILALHDLGAAYQKTGRPERGFPLLADALGRLQRVAPDDSLTLICMNNLATCCEPAGQVETARKLLEEAYERTKTAVGPDNPATLACMGNLAGVYQAIHRTDLAQPLLEEAFRRSRKALGPAHPGTIEAMKALASLYREIGHVDLVVPLAEQQAKVAREKFGPTDRRTLSAESNFAASLWSARQLNRSIPLFERLLRRQEMLFGRDDPSTLLAILNLGQNYADAGRAADAKPLLEEAYGRADEYPQLLQAATSLLRVNAALGDLERGLAIARAGIARMEERLGPDHKDTWTGLTALGISLFEAGRFDESIPLFEDLLERLESALGRHAPRTLSVMRSLAMSYRAAGRSERALALAEEVMRAAEMDDAAPSGDVELLLTRADCLRSLGQIERAIEVVDEALPQHRARGHEGDAAVLEMEKFLGGTYWKLSRFDDAISAFERTLEIEERIRGREDPATVLTIFNLAANYREAGRFAEAAPLYTEVIRAIEEGRAGSVPPLESFVRHVVDCFDRVGEPDRGTAVLEGVVKSLAARLGPDDPKVLLTSNVLAVRCWQAGRLDRSIAIFEDLLARHERKLGRGHLDTLRMAANLGVNYAAAGRYDEAIPLLREGHEASTRHPQLAFVTMALFDAYATSGASAEAVALLDRVLPEMRKRLPRASPRLAGFLAQASVALVAQEKWDEAEPLIRECVAIRQKAEPKEWSTFNAKSLLGAVLLGKGRLVEAEPLLLEGCCGMMDREDAIPPIGKPRLDEAIERLIVLYERTDRSEEAATWRRVKEMRKPLDVTGD